MAIPEKGKQTTAQTKATKNNKGDCIYMYTIKHGISHLFRRDVINKHYPPFRYGQK